MFRPFSTSSLTHKKLMATVHANSRATYKTKYVQGAADPEKLRLAAEKVGHRRVSSSRRLWKIHAYGACQRYLVLQLEADKIRNRRRLKAQRSSHAGRLDANALEGGNDVDQRNVYLSGTDDSDLSDDPYASAVRRRAPASGNRRRAPRAGGAGSTADSSDGEDLDEYEKDDFVVDDDEEIEVGEEDEEEEEDDLDDFAMKRDDKREVSGADASSSVQDKRRRQVVSDDEEEQDED